MWKHSAKLTADSIGHDEIADFTFCELSLSDQEWWSGGKKKQGFCRSVLRHYLCFFKFCCGINASAIKTV
jgi:hypothetical protein